MSKYVLVYTMNKVGSSSVKKAAESGGSIVGRAHPLNFHTIDLNDYGPVITIVRDPIARNLSAFMEFRDNYFDPFPSEYSPDMLQVFIDQFPHEEPEWWFSQHVYPNFSLDVLGVPFPKTKGWKIYDGFFLVIKTEALNRAFPEAFRSLTDLGDDVPIVIEHRAIGFEKHGPETGAVYKEFLENAKFDQAFLDRMYETAFVKHFYLASEIKKFRNRWTDK
ncbi:hypothetical protein LCGC14_2437100 [marine sediment metagenome]|uniref:Sulfotransferase domain-containing protein n=1 Tax=marine sediment metagenome TaxID=412755 RepID=A0A0F9C7J2_9ZZZZ